MPVQDETPPKNMKLIFMEKGEKGKTLYRWWWAWIHTQSLEKHVIMLHGCCQIKVNLVILADGFLYAHCVLLDNC